MTQAGPNSAPRWSPFRSLLLVETPEEPVNRVPKRRRAQERMQRAARKERNIIGRR